uniref:Uncharacterized protein n=1 Tax=Glossina pallidipes TaxID=7398 RepID=A0A1B0AA23_GLOPL
MESNQQAQGESRENQVQAIGKMASRHGFNPFLAFMAEELRGGNSSEPGRMNSNQHSPRKMKAKQPANTAIQQSEAHFAVFENQRTREWSLGYNVGIQGIKKGSLNGSKKIRDAN